MGQHVLPGNPPIAITLRRSSRARRISLRVSGVDGRVTLTLPNNVTQKEGLAFAEDKSGWLRKQLDRHPELECVKLGTELPVEGRRLRIAQGSGKCVTCDTGMIYVPGPTHTIAARLQGWLKVQAREKLVQASDHYAAILGRTYSKVALRDTRSRWGSCTHQGGLMYSWRLILAPPEVLDYVAAHEVAHLVEMNHSSRFWSTVENICPGFEQPRRWLRDQGTTLHRYRFESQPQD
ncbi:M48 family metallopeptidase [Roseovarius phycicola]|uniref:SprT family zinc-dependent metalloprotease n=1 Tax=Roseovarius phycicola TaxID=3080976 RepID=A0ABZ2HJM6_9RHOB